MGEPLKRISVVQTSEAPAMVTRDVSEVRARAKAGAKSGDTADHEGALRRYGAALCQVGAVDAPRETDMGVSCHSEKSS